jgi:hypothetical protein
MGGIILIKWDQQTLSTGIWEDKASVDIEAATSNIKNHTM